MQRYLPNIAASFTGIQVGAALVASEVVVEMTGAAGLGFWRYLIASIVLISLLDARMAEFPTALRHANLGACSDFRAASARSEKSRCPDWAQTRHCRLFKRGLLPAKMSE